MKRAHQNGQGMISFLVAAIFLLVPISLGINYLAKLGDARHKTYEAARYSAWERIVWSPSDTTYNVKTTDEINNEAVRRIFGRAHLPLNSDTDKTNGKDQFDLEPNLTLWAIKNQRSSVLEKFGDNLHSSLSLTNNTASSGLPTATNEVASTFDLSNRGFYNAEVTFHFSKSSILKPELMAGTGSQFLAVTAQSALLVEAWNAKSTTMVTDQVRRTLLTAHFNNSALNTLKTAISVFHPEINKFKPEIVEPDMLPCQRLIETGSSEDGQKKSCI